MDAVAAAVSDPVRRAILEAVAARPLAANDVAALFPISRPAVSRHLRVLRDSGLVSFSAVGRHRYYSVDTRPLGALAAWVAALDSIPKWDARFDALETEVRRAGRDRRAVASVRPAASDRKETA